MKVELGPILHFRGSENGNWKLAAIIVADEGPGELVTTNGIEPESRTKQTAPLREYGDWKVHRYEFEIPLSDASQKIEYRFANNPGMAWTFHVPARAASPRMAYASCNGFSNPKDMKNVPDQNRLWREMAKKHGADPFHLLLMGGDQVYADEIWHKPLMKDWLDLDEARRRGTPFSEAMAKEVRDFYFGIYRRRWTQKDPRPMFAGIPCVMMWDDHDIFDGWGSYDKGDQECPVYRGVFRHAREDFRLFQRALPPVDLDQGNAANPNDPVYSCPPYLGDMLVAGEIVILALDMRSQRTLSRVIDQAQWDEVYRKLGILLETNKNDPKFKHLLVMSSIPVVHPDFSKVEDFLSLLPGRQEVEDDLKDHWHSRTHKGERERLVANLLTAAKNSGIRVTILSGDVHVGAVGVIESKREKDTPENAGVISQLTSSAIVHPAPPGIFLFALERLMTGEEEEMDTRGVYTRMLKFPGTRNYFVGARNWMSLSPDKETNLWVDWHVEEATDPYTKVIHPVA